MLEKNDRFGFIIADGNGCLFGALQGNTKTILEDFSVDLPRKHGRGGQSKNRFERIRTEKRHNYLREISEAAVDNFITDDLPNIRGLIIAGSAEIKNDLMKSDLFDKRLMPVIFKVLDIGYGGENGFNQTIQLCSEDLKSVKFLQEKKSLTRILFRNFKKFWQIYFFFQ